MSPKTTNKTPEPLFVHDPLFLFLFFFFCRLSYDVYGMYLRRIRYAQVILLSFEGDDGEASKYRGVSLRAHSVADPACFRPGSLQGVY